MQIPKFITYLFYFILFYLWWNVLQKSRLSTEDITPAEDYSTNGKDLKKEKSKVYFEYFYLLTLSPPAVKTQWLLQCQAFQRLVRSSHTLVNWTFDLLNRFWISLACFWKHWILFASVCNINTSGQWKESLGQTSLWLCSSFSGRTNATSALSLGVA
jgi:hypothetical protein